jgi:hypothetical protein
MMRGLRGMSLRTLYLDTSVVGGYFDPEYQKETRQLWELWKSGHFRLFSSVVVEEEIEPAPERVRRLYAQTFAEADRLPLSMEAIELAALYVRQRVVTSKYLSDARHVAICAEARDHAPRQLEFPASRQRRTGGRIQCDQSVAGLSSRPYSKPAGADLCALKEKRLMGWPSRASGGNASVARSPG